MTDQYCTPEQMAAHFADAGAQLDDAAISLDIDAVSRWIDDYTGRRFWLDPADALTTKTYRPDDPYTAWVDDIGTTIGLVVKTDPAGDGTWSTTWAASDYQLEPLNPVGAHSYTRIVAVDRYTYPRSCRRVSLQVTARHGWSEVPDRVVKAAIIATAALYQRRESKLGVADFNGYGAVRVSQYIDPDVLRMLQPFRRLELLVA